MINEEKKSEEKKTLQNFHTQLWKRLNLQKHLSAVTD